MHMSEPEHPPPALVVTLAALTVVSGFIDAVSFLGLGHVFTANMTGNVLLIGFAAAGAAGFSVTASLCALGAFLVGAVVGGRLALRVPPVRKLLLVAMVIEAACTAAAATIAGTVPAVGSGLAPLHRHRSARRGGGPPELGRPPHGGPRHVHHRADHDPDRDWHPARGWPAGPTRTPGWRTTSVVCMFGGALVGAVLVLHAGATWSLGIAAGIVTVARPSSTPVRSPAGSDRRVPDSPSSGDAQPLELLVGRVDRLQRVAQQLHHVGLDRATDQRSQTRRGPRRGRTRSVRRPRCPRPRTAGGRRARRVGG